MSKDEQIFVCYRARSDCLRPALCWATICVAPKICLAEGRSAEDAAALLDECVAREVEARIP